MDKIATWNIDKKTVDELIQSTEPITTAFDERDRSFNYAVINGLILLGATGEVEEFSFDDDEVKEPPTKGSFFINITPVEDPVYGFYVDGKCMGGMYFSFRGRYQGGLWRKKDNKSFYTNSWDYVEGEWIETNCICAEVVKDTMIL